MKLGRLENGAALSLDIPKLVDTRMLIQANSGGGKSWLMRLIAERAGIQTIVLDPEGEFASLREKLDMVLAGHGGEVAAEPRSAALLARRLVEFKASAVIDLYDLKLGERRRFIKLFLDAMMTLGRELWHPMLLMLDEAHVYCPERSSGESEATESVIAMMSQGRKRGFAGILATQRLSKLHKDAAAETNNVIIGRTWLDADQSRCGDLLGMAKAERLALRDLKQGEFYGFGPALSVAGATRFISDTVATTHPQPGSRHLMTPPAPSQAVMKVLAKLADLPREADEEARTLEQMRAENARLKRELAAKPKPVAAPDESAIARAVAAQKHEFQQRMQDAAGLMQGAAFVFSALTKHLDEAKGKLAPSFAQAIELLTKDFVQAPLHAFNPVARVAQPVERRAHNEQVARSTRGANSGDDSLGGPHRKLLIVLAQAAKPVSKKFLALRAGYAHNGGAFNNPLGRLRALDYVTRGDPIEITEAGLESLGDYEPLPSGAALLEYWLAHLDGPAAKILRVVADVWPDLIGKNAVAAAAGYSPDGGAFNNPLGRLRTLGLVSRGTELRAAEELFD